MKTCSRCREEKPLTAFGKRPSRPSGIKSQCKACEAAAAREYRVANPERQREIKRRSYLKHREQVLEYSRRWTAEHPDHVRARNKKYRLENPELVALAMRRWQVANPERVREIEASRRARKLDAWVEDVDRQAVYERDGGKCHICGGVVSRDDFNLDHLIPLSRGGEHSYQNVALAHPRCNFSRGAGRIPAQLLLIGR